MNNDYINKLIEIRHDYEEQLQKSRKDIYDLGVIDGLNLAISIYKEVLHE